MRRRVAPEHAENPFALAKRLLVEVPLTPGQLAQLRAINTKYYTMLASVGRSAGMNDSMLPEHRAMVAAEIREMLTVEQRVVFDRTMAGVSASDPKSTE
jgi:hypothetical protein